jgi:hypothetical protein
MEHRRCVSCRSHTSRKYPITSMSGGGASLIRPTARSIRRRRPAALDLALAADGRPSFISSSSLIMAAPSSNLHENQQQQQQQRQQQQQPWPMQREHMKEPASLAPVRSRLEPSKGIAAARSRPRCPRRRPLKRGILSHLGPGVTQTHTHTALGICLCGSKSGASCLCLWAAAWCQQAAAGQSARRSWATACVVQLAWS